MWVRLYTVTLALGGCLSAGVSQTPRARAAVPPDSTWLHWDAATRTATLQLIAGIPGRAKSPFNFNGYTDGELTVRLPQAANVVMTFVNDDGTPHSAQVIADARPLPNMAVDQAAIPRAYTRSVSEGIGQFGKDVVRFKAAPAGKYLIYCGVPGHGLSGMWIRMEVVAGGEVPALVETPAK
jgi:sulfocyanin